jgi:DNA polymerase-3 subunit epsilon
MWRHLHKFTNLSRPVDFAGRMVYNEQGEELINFGKHKGKSVEDVLKRRAKLLFMDDAGRFPACTPNASWKRYYTRWNAKKA